MGRWARRVGKLARRAATGPVQVPERVKMFRAIVYSPDKCLGCGACARACPSEAIECARRRSCDERVAARWRTGRAAVRVCRDDGQRRFPGGRGRPGPAARTLRGRQWCSRESQARLLEMSENDPQARFVLAGCSQDFAQRRFHGLLSRGLRLEIADIREGCSWVHREDSGQVTEKARRLILSALAHPTPAADKTPCRQRVNGVLVIGGGVAGTQAAVEMARMDHAVELIEERPFLGGRAARIGVVFPTNDCGQCLPTTDAQLGTRKCFHRNLAIDHPNLHVWRSTVVESVSGRAGDFQVNLRQLPNIVTTACINCGTCETVCRQTNSAGTGKAIYAEFYDGRVPRTIDLEKCMFCGECVESCPVQAIDFTQSPRRVTVNAGAILIASRLPARPGTIHLPPGLRPARRGHADRILRDDDPLGGGGGRRPHARPGSAHDPVRGLPRQAVSPLLLAAVLHDRAEARHPACAPSSRR